MIPNSTSKDSHVPPLSILKNHLPLCLFGIAGIVTSVVSAAGYFKVINFGIQIAGRVIPTPLLFALSIALTASAVCKLYKSIHNASLPQKDRKFEAAVLKNIMSPHVFTEKSLKAQKTSPHEIKTDQELISFLETKLDKKNHDFITNSKEIISKWLKERQDEKSIVGYFEEKSTLEETQEEKLDISEPTSKPKFEFDLNNLALIKELSEYLQLNEVVEKTKQGSIDGFLSTKYTFLLNFIDETLKNPHQSEKLIEVKTHLEKAKNCYQIDHNSLEAAAWLNKAVTLIESK